MMALKNWSVWGGGQMAHRVLKNLYKFVGCLETYLKLLMILGHGGPPQGSFYPGSPEISRAGSILGSLGASRRVQEVP